MVSAPASPGDRERRFDAGSLLFRRGEPCQRVLVLRSGSVRVSRDLGGRAITLAVLGPGDLVGEDGLAEGIHGTDATALEPTLALSVEIDELEAMVEDGGELAIRLVRALVDRVGAAQERLLLVAHPSAARLAGALGHLAQSLGRDDPDGVLIPRRLREIADDVGLDEAVLAEAAKTLLARGLVRVRRHGIVVPSAERMYEFMKGVGAVGEDAEDEQPVNGDGA